MVQSKSRRNYTTFNEGPMGYSRDDPNNAFLIQKKKKKKIKSNQIQKKKKKKKINK